jgi:hypothetical protein
MYLKLYQVSGNPTYLAEADQLFSWLEDVHNGPIVKLGHDMVTWDLALDPQGGNTPKFPTGIEEGNAGIGWTYLQAYKLTGEQRYLAMAKRSANWLLNVAVRSKAGLSWHEDMHPTNPIIHANLDNGAAGIGMFLKDLGDATQESTYLDGAQGAQNWLMATAVRDGKKVYWKDNGGNDPYSDDPSLHWGTAGIVTFMLRMQGSKTDMPGEQPALSPRR